MWCSLQRGFSCHEVKKRLSSSGCNQLAGTNLLLKPVPAGAHRTVFRRRINGKIYVEKTDQKPLFNGSKYDRVQQQPWYTRVRKRGELNSPHNIQQ